MKNILFISCMWWLAISCTTPSSDTFEVTVTNPSASGRDKQPVVLSISSFNAPFQIKGATVWEGANETASQLDDLDGDGLFDELIFLTDLEAQSQKTFKVKFSPEARREEYPSQVYAEMLLSEKEGNHQPIQSLTVPGGSDVYNLLHHHGPAFESCLVAFRTYFDARQSVDIYGKQREGLELQTTRFYPTPEQVKEGYGDDVLWAGSSVGLGSLRGMEKGKLLNIEPVEWRTECIRAYGPLRTVIDINDTGWSYGTSRLNMRARYILYGGHRDVEIQLHFDEPLQEEQFATGLIRLNNAQEFFDGKGLAACWGDNFPYGPQGDTIVHPRVTIGLGLYIPEEEVTSAPKDEQNLLYTIGAKGENDMTYHITFCSKGEKDGFKSADEWFSFINDWSAGLKQSVQVTVSNH